MLRMKLAACGVVVLMALLSQTRAYALEYRMKPGLALYHWNEELAEGTLKESGPIVTFDVSLVDFPSVKVPALVLRGNLGLFLGRVRYEGFAQDSFSLRVTPLDSHTTYLGFTSEGSLGRRHTFGSVEVEPFLGLGVRWWVRVIETTDSASGYPEFYTLVNGRIGVAADYREWPGLTLHTAVSLKPMLWAQERVDLSDTAVNDGIGGVVRGEEVTVKNGKRPGWTLDVGVQRGMLDLTAYWQATRFGESPRVSCYQGTSLCRQPESDQDIIGFNLGFVF